MLPSYTQLQTRTSALLLKSFETILNLSRHTVVSYRVNGNMPTAMYRLGTRGSGLLSSIPFYTPFNIPKAAWHRWASDTLATHRIGKIQRYPDSSKGKLLVRLLLHQCFGLPRDTQYRIPYLPFSSTQAAAIAPSPPKVSRVPSPRRHQVQRSDILQRLQYRVHIQTRPRIRRRIPHRLHYCWR
jgi:hypothetical protein